MSRRVAILSLCDYSGVWGDQYADDYEVIKVDLQCGGDVRLFECLPRKDIRGIIAQPPCDHLAGSGARWWAGKGRAALLDALSIADACLRAVAIYKPAWWVLENPVGRLSKYYGKPEYTFHPHQYAGYADDPDSEAYTKRTCLWGRFKIPETNPVDPALGSKMHRLGPGPQRKNIRSKTPQGFARAFRSVNQ